MEEALAPHLGYLGRLRDPEPPTSVCLGPIGCCAWQKEQHTWSWLAGECGRGGQSACEQGVLQGSRVSFLPEPSAPCTASSPGAHKPGPDSVCLGVLPEKGAEVLAPVISKLSEKFSCSDIISFLCYYKELGSYYGIGGNSIEPFKINSDRKRDMIA